MGRPNRPKYSEILKKLWQLPDQKFRLQTLLNTLVLALAGFTLINITLAMFSSRYDGNWIWITTWLLPISPKYLLLAFSLGVFICQTGWKPILPFTRITTMLIAMLCLCDSFIYYYLLWDSHITSSFPLPFSLILALLLIAWIMKVEKAILPRLSLLPYGVMVFLASLLLLLVQILTFGTTDYRRYTNAIIVFGAGVQDDGSPSDALYHRTHTGCMLYKQGFAKYLVFSGGRNPRMPVSEPQAMRKIALTLGVAAEDIILDEQGNNTLATVRNSLRLASENNWHRVLMVSHDYHLSRIKFFCYRLNLSAYTVPAHEDNYLIAKPYYIFRELIAWMYYYFNIGKLY